MGKLYLLRPAICGLLIFTFFSQRLFAQPPASISYSGSPFTYYTGTAITPLTPTSTSIAAQGYNPPVTVNSLSEPTGIAIDAAGNIYTANYGSPSIYKYHAGGSGSPSAVGSGLGGIVSVAVDQAGNVYVGEYGVSTIQEIPVGGGAQVSLGSGFAYATGIAVDAAGDVYVADYSNGYIKKIPAGNGTPVVVVNGTTNITALAIDGAGDLYYTLYSGAAYELQVGSSSPTALGSGYNQPFSIAVDPAGDVFIADSGHGTIKEIPEGSSTPITIGTDNNYPDGVAIDPSGNIFIINSNTGTLQKMAPSGGYYLSNFLPAGLSFNESTGVISGTPTTASAATNYTVTAWGVTGGSVSATLNITVNQQPASLSYTSPQTYAAGTAITPLTPTSGSIATQAYGSSPVTVSATSNTAVGVAADAAGNVYALYASGEIDKAPANGTFSFYTTVGAFPGTGSSAIASDAAGNLYVAASNYSFAVEVHASDLSQSSLGSGFDGAQGIAVDGSGNVYVANVYSGAVNEIPAGNGSPVTLAQFSVNTIRGLAVDASGNVYVADDVNNVIHEIPAGGGPATSLGSFAGGLDGPYGLVVDAAGNVYTANNVNGTVTEIPVGNGTIMSLATGVGSIQAVTVDASGNLFFPNANGPSIEKLAPVGGYYISRLPAGLSFNENTGVISGTPTAASAATNYTVTGYDSYSNATANLTITVNPLVPTLSYSGPQSYATGTAITPLTPTSSGVAAQAYGASPGTVPDPVHPGITGLATDASQNVYLLASAGAILKAASGGSFSNYASASTANTTSLASDATGNLYITSTNVDHVIEVRASDQSQVSLGSGFSSAAGVAVDQNGNVYVADAGNSAVKEIRASDGTVVTLASGITNILTGIAVDAAGNVYFACQGISYLQKIPAGGGAIVNVGSGLSDPDQLAVDAAGNIYVADAGLNKMFEIPSTGGQVITLASMSDGAQGVAIDNSGILYYNNGSVVQKLSPVGGYYMGPFLPAGLIFSGNTGVISGTPTVVSAAANYTVTAWNSGGSASATVNIATFIPTPSLSYASPQTYFTGAAITPLTPTSANVAAQGYSSTQQTIGGTFTGLQGVATDVAGNVYVADNTQTSIIEYPAAGGSPVNIGSGLSNISAVVVDHLGNVYVGETGANTIFKLPVGGGAAVAMGTGFEQTFGLAVDSLGDVFVADHHFISVYKISAANGSTVRVTDATGFTGATADGAGNAYFSWTPGVWETPAGTFTPHQVISDTNTLAGLAIDAAGDIFLVDATNNQIEELVAGSSSLVTIATGFNAPNGIAVDGAGNIYVADAGNHAIKKITPSGGYYLNKTLPAGLSLNSSTGIISGTPTTATAAANYAITAWNSITSGSATVNLAVIKPSTTINAINTSTGSNAYSNAASVNYTVTFGAAVTGLTASNFSLTTGGSISGASIGTPTSTDNINWTVPINTGTGDGTIILNLANATGLSDLISTTLPFAGQTYTIDKTTPTATLITPPTAYVTGNGNFVTNSFTITYNDADSGIDPSTFSNANFSVSDGGFITGFSAVGSTVTYNVEVPINSNPTSESVTISLNGNSVYNLAGTPVAANANFTSFVVDNIPPAITISAPSVSVASATNPGSVTYTVSYSDDNFNNSTLSASDITLNTTGTATATVSVDNSTGSTRTVTLSNISGDGTVGISIGANTASDLAGNEALASGASTTFTVESSDATLSSIALSNGTLNPAFISATTTYTATVGNGLTSITVTPTAHDPNATVIVNGKPASTAVPLVVGTNHIAIVVTAADGVTQKTYNLTVTESQSANNNLASVKTSAGFAQGLTVPTTLTESVVNSVSSITVTPTVVDPTATVKVNNALVTSGSASTSIPLNVGQNTITILVTAADSRTQTYTLTVTRAVSANDNLANLVMSNGTLSPEFGTATNYLDYVGNGAKLTLTPTLADPTATLTINGKAATSGAATAVPLIVGNNTITIVVTAQNTTSTKTYTVVVNEARSLNNTLFSFKTSGGLAKGQTVPTTLTESVVNAVSSITVTPTTADATATVKVNNVTVTSGTASASIPLAVGQTTITTVVTAQNGTQLTYTLTVTRAPGAANNVYQPVSVGVQNLEPQLADDGVVVHQGVSPNGDGVNDYLQIDNISNYPDNNLKIMNRNGLLVFEAKGYDNATKVFDGHSNKNGQMQLPGTYFYELDYTANGVTKHKTGYLVLKY